MSCILTSIERKDAFIDSIIQEQYSGPTCTNQHGQCSYPSLQWRHKETKLIIGYTRKHCLFIEICRAGFVSTMKDGYFGITTWLKEKIDFVWSILYVNYYKVSWLESLSFSCSTGIMTFLKMRRRNKEKQYNIKSMGKMNIVDKTKRQHLFFFFFNFFFFLSRLFIITLSLII